MSERQAKLIGRLIGRLIALGVQGYAAYHFGGFWGIIILWALMPYPPAEGRES